MTDQPSSVLSDAEIATALTTLGGWRATDGGIARSFKFKDFSQAFAFMTRVALLAEKANHHPDWSNSYNRVEIVLVNHDKGGVTQKDIDLASAIDGL